MLGVACGSLNSEFRGPKYKGDFFVYRTQKGDADVCEGAVDRLEEEALLFADLLGTELPRRGKYYKFKSSDALSEAEVCRSTAGGCYSDDTIYSILPVDGHELSHWVMGAEFGTKVPLLFAEGIANAVSCEPHFLPETDEWDYRDFGSEPPISDSFNHAQAGRLLLGVWAQGGNPSSWMDLLALPEDASPSELGDRAMKLGVDLDAAWSLAVQRHLPACIPIYACSGAPLPWGTSTLNAGCDGFEPATLPLVESGGGALSLLGLDRQASPLFSRGEPPSSPRGSPARARRELRVLDPENEGQTRNLARRRRDGRPRTQHRNRVEPAAFRLWRELRRGTERHRGARKRRPIRQWGSTSLHSSGASDPRLSRAALGQLPARWGARVLVHGVRRGRRGEL